jgi:cell wall-associated NlpC family hydrolase
VALTGIAVSPGAAHADPTPEELEAQIDDAWRDLEPIIEEHNATRIELDDKRDEADALAEKIEPLQVQVDVALAEVADIAVFAYKGGNTSAFNALLASGSPYVLADQLAVLDQFAKSQQQSIAEVAEIKDEYEAEKADLDAMVAELTVTEEDLAEKADEIDAEIDRLQDLRTQAYGENGGLGELRPAPCPATYPGGAVGDVVKFACAQIGKPYQWGDAGPDAYDCSGLILAAWAQAGVNLPHNAAAQRAALQYVEREDLRPGDLVFYYSDLSHAGIYVGSGWIVHASQSGVPVKMNPLDGSPIHSFGRP